MSRSSSTTGCTAISDYRLAHGISRLLLSLYALASAARLDEFDAQVLELLREHIDFDSGWFGHSTLTPTGPRLHSSRLYNVRPDFLTEWTQVKRSDPMAGIASESPGTAVAIQTRVDPRVAPLRSFCRRQNISQVLFSAYTGPAPKRVTHVSLYRESRRSRYTGHDAHTLELVIQHIASALEQNRLHWMRATSSEPDSHSVAMFDSASTLQYADVHFHDLMLCEWPDWDGITLPDTVCRALAAQSPSPSTFAGRHVKLTGKAVSGFMILSARPVGLSCLLSPRELSVVQMFCEGLSYKAVAKQLGLAPATVRHHLRQAYTKLGVHNKGELSRRLWDESRHA